MKNIEKAAIETGKVRLPDFSPMEWIEQVDGHWQWCQNHGGMPVLDCFEIGFEDWIEWEPYLGEDAHPGNL